MAATFHMAGFRVYDVTMSDILHDQVDLDEFNGIAFVGGFSYADVFGSAKGWASMSTFNSGVAEKLEKFLSRADTFSLGVCNGCQLMSLLGWVGSAEDVGVANKASDDVTTSQRPQPNTRFTTNTSERFESRFVNVKIVESASVMLRGMEGSHLGVWVAHGEFLHFFIHFL